ncbi:ABC transporter permease [Helicobacter sp. 12S02634-8]|uniref:methionine ABC transporter permease n=1 Tax=Helicobacter sp. 12S02634-8 TaxID=1476199 RepID=UPI000BA502C1|nr:methionine ABC transporter permease [Helicobacter sp. 12S02634-8]PAF46628.1 ABC transporter permease [Helicobacter sp. 12S02634-8]
MIFDMIYDSTLETLYMVFFSCVFAVLFGLPLGVLLQITKHDGILPMPVCNKILGGVVNTARSFPFIILVILLLPLSRLLIGTSIGSTAAIIPLSISAIPFVARLFEGALAEVSKGLIEASLSMGANKSVIIKMMIAESLPALVNALIITAISLIGYSAMAGALGAGGLGDLAIRIGYQTYRPDVLFYACVTIIILVQIIQTSGDLIVKRLRKYK